MSSHHAIIGKLTKTLEEWDYKIDRLEHRIKDLPDEVTASVQAKCEDLKKFRQNLIDRERSLEEKTAKTVQEIELSIEETAGAMKLLFEEIELDVHVDVS